MFKVKYGDVPVGIGWTRRLEFHPYAYNGSENAQQIEDE